MSRGTTNGRRAGERRKAPGVGEEFGSVEADDLARGLIRDERDGVVQVEIERELKCKQFPDRERVGRRDQPVHRAAFVFQRVSRNPDVSARALAVGQRA